jgi:multiple sugar transport system substrate-binding protein
MRISAKRKSLVLATAVATALALSACGDGGGFDDDTGGGDGGEGTSADGPAELTMLIASSGDAETAAVEDAVERWGEESGNTVTVTVASDMNQELAQGFSGGNPPDIFYLDASQFANYASNGSLYAYGDQVDDPDDFYESLRDTFTYEDTLQCAPKDFSTLALEINDAAWKKAGLTDADIPTDWDQLASVAEQLTSGDQVGLGLSPGIDRLGAFVVGNGGWWLNDDNTEATGASPEVVDALTYVQDNMKKGSFALSSQLDAGWGGEAFGTGKAAMTIEGNWIKGAMTNDYPDVKYTVAPMPAGPAGEGTLLFTQCWGIASDSDAQEQAVDLVNFLTSADQQLAFAEAFGVMPSRQSASGDYESAFPEDQPFIAGGDYGHGPITAPGMEQVISDVNSQLEGIEDADIQSVMDDFDTNADAALGQ